MHAHLEEAKISGELPPQDNPEARVATSAMQYWPDDIEWHPEVRAVIERDGFAWAGYCDQLGLAFSGDYKFTGNKKNIPGWKARIKNDALALAAADELKDDVQVVFYGVAAAHFIGIEYYIKDEEEKIRAVISLDPQTEYVWSQWTYTVKPPKMEGEPTVIPVDMLQSTGLLLDKLEMWDDVARAVIFMRENYTEANDVPHNANEACDGVGSEDKCDFAYLCEITKKGKVMSKTMDLEALKAKMAAKKKNLVKREAEEPSVNPPEGEDADLELEDVEEVPKPKKRVAKKKVTKKVVKKAKKVEEPEEPEEPEEEEDEDEEEEAPAPKKRVAKKVAKKREEPATVSASWSDVGFEAMITNAGTYKTDKDTGEEAHTHIALIGEEDAIIPVGQKVRVIPCE